MEHYGDITAIHGYNVPIVDIITGGSPCQDLSVAGKRAGLAGERSGLFMEQIRIIKEMREQSARISADNIRPRYMVWENVPGAFSSNGGEDFRAVLEETAKIADESAVIPRPEGGRWHNSGCILADGWSIAWRVHDAQFWGVAQRRRRISLVADFGGQTAPEILFERESVCGYSAQSGEQGQGAAGAAETSIDTAISFQERAGCEGGVKASLSNEDTQGHCQQSTDNQSCNATTYRGDSITSKTNASQPKPGDPCHTLSTDSRNYLVLNDQGGSVMSASVDVCGTLRAQEHGHQSAICIQGNCIDRADTAGCNGKGWTEDVSYTLNTIDRPAVCLEPRSQDGVCHLYDDVVPTLNTAQGGPRQPCVMQQEIYHSSKNSFQPRFRADGVTDSLVASDYKDPPVLATSQVRRLTPLEGERLQGYPDGWTDIDSYVDSKGKTKQASDSARYKALGNSIALPFWAWLARRICAQYVQAPTMASLFDGIGGFPLVFSRAGCTPIWASEIEEFPIAVTKRHFSERSENNV